MDYWEQKLKGEAAFLDSLKFFHPQFISLSSTHPIFTTCGSSPYEVSKAQVQARYLSGRARIEALSRHWDPSNKIGLCLLCKDASPQLGTMEHLLVSGGCPELAEARLIMFSFFQSYLVPKKCLLPILKECWERSEVLTMQLLLDCSAIPSVIKVAQELGEPIPKDLF